MSRAREGAADLLLRSLDDLRRPEAYPHPVRSVRVVQTATSAVFLTGGLAYKVKKPVRYAFLDYRSLEERRRLCEREIELNRRLCPAIYLGVDPITEEAGRLRVGGAGQPAEWAVRMRELPAADMLPARLAAGTVGVADAAEIAAVLAGFHARAASGPEIDSFAAPARLSANIEESFRITRDRRGAVLPPAHFEAVRGWCRGFGRAGRTRFERRISAGRIRDGHGDLRAQNICLHEGVQVFDCIEFNDRFRCEDVANEIAYLAMDFDLAGRPDLSAAFVDAYAARSGDADLEAVLPYYRVCRAYIRGEIALLALEEPEIPRAERDEHAAMGKAAFDLARSYTRPAGRPALWITVGVSGSGKTVLSSELARRLPALRIATDELRRELAGVPAPEPLGSEWYTPARLGEVYRVLFERAAQRLQAGTSVILDATFLDASSRSRARRLADDSGAELRVLECRCEPDLARRRLRRRATAGTDASEADLRILEGQLGRSGGLHESLQSMRGVAELVTAESGLPATDLARRALAGWWGSGPPIPSGDRKG